MAERRDGASRYEELLAVATELFGERGYDGTTVRMIADRMGILSGSLYSHIARKEDILRALVLSVGEEFLTAALAAREQATDPPAALRALCHAHLEIVHRRQTAVVVYYGEWRQLAPEVQAEIIALRERYQGIFQEVLDAGAASGALAAGDMRAAALVVLSTLNWTAQWYRADGSLSHPQVADWVVDVLLRGLLPRS